MIIPSPRKLWSPPHPLVLVALLGAGSLAPPLTPVAQAQSRSASRTPEHVRARQAAEQLLAQSRWEDARLEALSSLDADSSVANEAARRVLVEVYLATDDARGAEYELAQLAAYAPTPPELAAWLDRAQQRLHVERLEAAGDAAGARALLTQLQPQLPGPAERAWWTRLDRRVTLRGFEQERRFAEGRGALTVALQEPELEAEDQRWLRGAGMRLDIAELWWSASWTQVAERAAAVEALVELRPSDRAWAGRTGQRAAIWALAQAGDEVGVRAAIAALGPAEQGEWTEGLLRWLDYASALAQPARKRDPAHLALLWPVVEPWQATQPPAVRLPAPPAPAPDGVSSWGMVGLVAGVGATAHSPAGEGELTGALCAAGPCMQAQAGLQVAGLWASGRGPGPWELGVWGHARVQEPRLVGVSPWPTPMTQGHLSLALARGPLALGLGPRLATGVYAWEATTAGAGTAESNTEHGVVTLVDVLVDVSARVALPQAGLDLGASAAAWPGRAYGGAELGWSAEQLPLRVGLHGAALAATRAAPAADLPALARREWQAGLNVSWQQAWR